MLLAAAARSRVVHPLRWLSAMAGKTKASGEAAGKEPVKKASKPAAEKTVFPRTPTPRRAAHEGASFRALSWNVAGLRALLANGNASSLKALVEEERPDLLCLQEHKLQLAHVAEAEKQLRTLLGPAYGAFYWAVSTETKGYSGVVVILRGGAGSNVNGVTSGASGAAAEFGPAGAPLGVRFGLGESQAHAVEGRTVTLEFSSFHVTSCYVPNSGEGLKRLEYRLGEWERDMKAHLLWLSQTKPALLGGDLNVAFRDADIYNVSAPHIKKSAGCTPQERAAFAALCAEALVADSFRAIHPDATGAFSYWSQRAGNKPWNRGLRLDYWLCSEQMAAPGAPAPALVDAFIVEREMGASDHAPVGIVLSL